MSAAREMPRYKCHKEVHAFKIKEMLHGPEGWTLVPADEGYEPFPVDGKFLERGPQPGGYYVVYEDGYTSYSPAAAFEGGYSKIES